jgi:Cyclic nucleotide-binding domain
VLLGPGMYFGELALLRGGPRAATAMAVCDTDLLELERELFNQLLGPLQAILEQAAASYGPSSVKRVRLLLLLDVICFPSFLPRSDLDLDIVRWVEKQYGSCLS